MKPMGLVYLIYFSTIFLTSLSGWLTARSWLTPLTADGCSQQHKLDPSNTDIIRCDLEFILHLIWRVWMTAVFVIFAIFLASWVQTDPSLHRAMCASALKGRGDDLRKRRGRRLAQLPVVQPAPPQAPQPGPLVGITEEPRDISANDKKWERDLSTLRRFTSRTGPKRKKRRNR